MHRAVAAGIVLAIVTLASASPLVAEEGPPAWVPGEWEGSWRGTAVLEGPDSIVLGPTFSTAFSFRIDPVSGTTGTMDDFGGEVTFSDVETGNFSLDVDFTACAFGGGTAEVLLSCSIRIFNVYLINDVPIPVEAHFDLVDAPLVPVAVTCDQAYGIRRVSNAPIAGTSFNYSVDVGWVAFRTGKVDAVDMRDRVDEHLAAIEAALAAGDAQEALDLIVGAVEFLEDLGNTAYSADTCSAGTPQQRRNLWGWFEEVVARVLRLVLQQKDSLGTDVIIQALYVGVRAGLVSTGSYDASRAASLKADYERELDARVDDLLLRLTQMTADNAPPAERGAVKQELIAIRTAALQFGMPAVASKIPSTLE